MDTYATLEELVPFFGSQEQTIDLGAFSYRLNDDQDCEAVILTDLRTSPPQIRHALMTHVSVVEFIKQAICTADYAPECTSRQPLIVGWIAV